jgi:hypothetical protein
MKNETATVFAMARQLSVTVDRMHDLFGGLHLAATPTLDIANEADLVRRWHDEHSVDDERSWDEPGDPERDVGASFDAAMAGATAAIDALDNALARADAEFNDLGAVSQKALGELSNSTTTVVEWTDVYLEATLGYYRVKGHLPDSWLGGGLMAEMRDWRRATELATALGAPAP